MWNTWNSPELNDFKGNDLSNFQPEQYSAAVKGSMFCLWALRPSEKRKVSNLLKTAKVQGEKNKVAAFSGVSSCLFENDFRLSTVKHT